MFQLFLGASTGGNPGDAVLATTLDALDVNFTGPSSGPAVGTVAVTGVASVTLGALSRTSTGTVEVKGTTSKTLAGLAISATGAGAGNGTLTKTLGTLTVSSAGSISISGTATKTLAAVTVSAAGGGAVIDEHAYFNELIARPDFWHGLSLRPQAGVTNASSPYWVDQIIEEDFGGFQVDKTHGFQPLAWTYDPSSDPDPSAQDASKLTIQPFYDPAGNTLVAPMTTSDTTLSCAVVDAFFTVGRWIKIDDEVMKITARDTILDTLTVTRAQYGTTAAVHSSGAAILLGTITCSSNLAYELQSNNEISRYFFTWDAYYTSTYVGIAGGSFGNHKAYQIETGADAIWFEPNSNYAPASAIIGSYVNGTDVAAFQVRSYTRVIASPTTNDEPILPVVNTFAIKPNKWTRYFALVKVRARDDPASYYDTGGDLLSTLAAEVSDVTLTVATTTSSTSLSCASAASAAAFEASFPVGGYLRIDFETCLITAVDGTAKTIGVTRAQLGQGSAVVHAIGAGVSVYAALSVDTTAVDLDVGMYGNRLYIKIDNEIMRCATDSGTGSGNPRTVPVARGQLGTAAVAHSAGAAVKVCANALVSTWMSDVDRDPVAHFLDMPVGVHSSSNPAEENSIAAFVWEWNTSSDEPRDHDLISYHRNWVVLKSPTLDPLADGLLDRPNAPADQPTGTLSKTLAALTVSAAGTLPIAGAVTTTLGTLTSAATGGVALVGTLSQGLSAATVSADGLIGLSSVIGELTATLAALSDSSAGTVSVGGVATPTLGALASTAAGTISLSGVAAVALDAAVVMADGTVGVAGVSAPTLAALTSVATGGISLSGILTKTLASVTIDAQGVIGSTPMTGTLAATLRDATVSGASGLVLILGTGSRTLDNVTVTATGGPPVQGALAVTLAPLTASAGDIIHPTPDVIVRVRRWVQVIRVRRAT